MNVASEYFLINWIFVLLFVFTITLFYGHLSVIGGFIVTWCPVHCQYWKKPID